MRRSKNGLKWEKMTEKGYKYLKMNRKRLKIDKNG